MRPARWVSLVLALACVGGTAAESSYVEGQMLVRFASTMSAADAEQSLGSQYEVIRVLVPSMNLYLVRLKGGLKVKEAVARMNRLDAVAYAQADHAVSLRAVIPDDPDFAKQWGLRNGTTAGADIKATDAWELGKGGKDRDGNDIVVAIIDGGVDVNHRDLKDNLWVNAGEVPNNNIDDDGNGYVDDVHGWNVYDNNGNIPANGHGTHVAGITGATGNNSKHVVGVNWNVKIMAVAGSSSTTSTVAAAYGYVLAQKKLWIESRGKKGANVVVTNSSFGVDLRKCTDGDFPVWNDLYEEMGKVGILSAAATANQNVDVDEKGDIPTSCTSPYIIKVTNTDKNDKRNNGAAFGKTTIELGAPGTAVVSTLPGDRTGSLTGTSMATPHVAGAVAFLHSVGSPDFARAVSRDPGEAALALKRVLLENVDPIPALQGITVTGGRLNLAAAAGAISRFQSRN